MIGLIAQVVQGFTLKSGTRLTPRKMQKMYPYKITSHRSILIADDSVLVRSALVQQITNSVPGIVITECDRGDSALETLKEIHETIELAILDNQMPSMDGVDVIKHIREYEDERNLKKIPILCMISGC